MCSEGRLQNGMSLVEAILASALFTILVGTVIASLLYSLDAVSVSGVRHRALFLAQEGLEAVQTIRDRGFELLTDGTYGLRLSNGQWSLVASPDITVPFTRSVTITTVDTKTKSVESSVSWPQSIQRGGFIVLTTHLANWRTTTVLPQSSHTTVSIDEASIGGSGNAELRGIEIDNTGSTPITIDRMTVNWVDPNQNIKSVVFEATTAWSHTGPGTPTSTQPTGTELDIQDVTINAGDDRDLTIRFSGNMSGNTFSIQFRFSDGSIKTMDNIRP